MSVPLMNLYVRLSIGPVHEEDVDALLRAMDAPGVEGESEQARADVLLRIVGDPAIGVLRGRDGRRLDETAAQALREQSARVAETVPPAQPSVKPRVLPVLTTWLSVSGFLGMFWGFYELFIAGMYLTKRASDDGLGWVSLLDTFITILLPSWLLLRTDTSNARGFLGGVLFLVLIAVPVGVLLSLVCVMLGGGRRVADTNDLALIFFLGSAARLLLLVPLGVALGRAKRQDPATPE